MMPNLNGKVILVDENDQLLGTENKLQAHLGKGQLHRAFSIFILDNSDRVLLQRRADSKYHCPGLWSNSCCSHPQPGADLVAEARKRLQFELGINAELNEFSVVQYRLELGDDMTEWELNHLFYGRYEGGVSPNPEEVADYKWVPLLQIEPDLRRQKANYTPWLPIVLAPLLANLS